jgi:hypothetical protein
MGQKDTLSCFKILRLGRHVSHAAGPRYRMTQASSRRICVDPANAKWPERQSYTAKV